MAIKKDDIFGGLVGSFGSSGIVPTGNGPGTSNPRFPTRTFIRQRKEFKRKKAVQEQAKELGFKGLRKSIISQFDDEELGLLGGKVKTENIKKLRRPTQPLFAPNSFIAVTRN